jgi:hypothetical protein
MKICVILLLLDILPLHPPQWTLLSFCYCSTFDHCTLPLHPPWRSLLLLLNFQLFTIEHIIIWQFNDATIIVFGNFFKLVQHFKDGYFEYFNNNSAQRMQDEKGNKKTTIGATHLCNANSNHTKVMALINYK